MYEFLGIDHHGSHKIFRQVWKQLVHELSLMPLLAVRGESPASTETVPAPAGQGAIRVHTGSMCPNRNAVRRDAGTVECRDDFCHGLVGHRLDFEGHTLRVENPDANLLRSQGHDGGYGHPGEPGSGAGVLLDRKGEIKPPVPFRGLHPRWVKRAIRPGATLKSPRLRAPGGDSCPGR